MESTKLNVKSAKAQKCKSAGSVKVKPAKSED